MVSLGVLLVGWFLGAIPLLLVLRAMMARHDKRIADISEAHAVQLDDVRQAMESAAETAVKDALVADRERKAEAVRVKKEREPRMIAVRPY